MAAVSDLDCGSYSVTDAHFGPPYIDVDEWRDAPYRHRLSVQVFWTTNGYQQDKIDYDAPYLFGSAFRLRAQVYYEKNTAENYFGRGSSTLNDLGFTAAGGRTYSDFGDYTSALRQIRPGNVAYTLYNKYSLEDPTLATTSHPGSSSPGVRLTTMLRRFGSGRLISS